MNNNLISFNSHQNVFLYFDGPDLKNCVNIDVKDGVDTVVFDGGNSPNLKGSADPLGSVLLSLIFNILFNRCL